MNTPICDFVERYCKQDSLRLHMPGHKGKSFLGFEKYDITEIDGADSLYHADGIIRESEKNAVSLFGTKATFYSCEGSSLCIRAMVYLAVRLAKQNGKEPLILAGRNAHKTFLTAAALLNVKVYWLYPRKNETYLSGKIEKSTVEAAVKKYKPTAVYLTTPDYLGGLCDVAGISQVCKSNDVTLLVDNAHGAYLKFLERSVHPIDLGADMCCDSAHKTLPVLTGGAYLHVSQSAPKLFSDEAKNALALFGSTSPSYLILQSLDKANGYLADGYRKRLNELIKEAESLKAELSKDFEFVGDEPLKITVKPKQYGYTGEEFAKELSARNIVCEFYDPDFAVLMLTPETGSDGLKRLKEAFSDIPKKERIGTEPPTIKR
ncbi:MAG: amino acid decarboxylase, partial [Acutalibacteraceae bacterium]